jgi:DNA-binding transcriptional ArsR family regulator
MFSSGHKATEQNSTPKRHTSFENLAATFFKVADARLSDTQKQLLCECYSVLTYHKLAVTALADLVSQRTKVPYSTVKWNLRSLMDMGLLEGGNSERRGRHARLTSSAEMLVRYLSKTEEYM